MSTPPKTFKLKPSKIRSVSRIGLKFLVPVVLITLLGMAAIGEYQNLLNHIGINYSTMSPDVVLQEIIGHSVPSGLTKIIVRGHAFGEPNQVWVYIEGDDWSLRKVVSGWDSVGQDDFHAATPAVPSGFGLLGKFHQDAVSARWFDTNSIRTAKYFILYPRQGSQFLGGVAVEDMDRHRLYMSIQG